MDTLRQDIRYALRSLRLAPGFASVVLLTLALGTSANTAIFSVIDTVLLSSPNFKNLHRLVMIFDVNRTSGGPDFDTNPSPGNFLDWRKESHAFDQMAAWRNWYYSLASADDGGSLPESVRGVRVSPSFFSMLGIDFALGRGFRADEEMPGHDQVVVLSTGLWKRRFGSNPDILGQRLRIDGRPFTVIGVLPADFCFLQPDFELWMPLSVDNEFRNQYDHSVLVFGRLAPGVSIAHAQAEMNSISAVLERIHPDVNLGWRTRIASLYPSQYISPAAKSLRSTLLILFGAVAMVLLIACANVANLLLARSELRRKEIAIRIAVGAGRSRLIRQMLTESVVLAAAGSALGLLVARCCLPAIASLLPRIPMYRFMLPRINASVFGFTLGIAVLTGIAFGLPPAFQVAKVDSLRGSSASPRGLRTGRLLMISELALSLVLLVSAALLLTSLWRLENVNPGFRQDHLLTMQVWLPKTKYPDRSSIVNFYQEVVRRVDELPGVRAAAAVNFRPFAGMSVGTLLEVKDRAPSKPGEPPPEVEYRIATPGYLRALGVPFLKGRDLSETDGPDAAGAVVVNETAAKRLWPNEDPIGKQVRPIFRESLSPWDAEADPLQRWLTVVGVAGNIKEAGLNDREHAEIYLSYLQFPSSFMFLVVRTEVPPASLSTGVENAVLAVDHDQPVSDLRTMESAIRESTTAPRLIANLLVVFVLLALFLSAAGVYGVMSYITSQRTQVIAIRMALGACPRHILIDVLREVSGLGVVAVAAGLIASIWLARTMKSLLFEVAPIDPIILAGASVVLLAIALTACYLPARKAARIDPMSALRN
jgi:putative ABC transport system permease protein